MRKLVYLIPAALLMMACSGEESTTEEVSDNTDQLTDTTAVDTVAESVDEGIMLESIEDYITIMSKAELYDLFDSTNLKDDESWYGEGTMKYDVTWLTNPVNGHRVKYVWDQEKSEDINFVEFHHTNYDADFNVTGTQEILSATGIYTGMPFEELKSWNDDEPFEFSGFGWDYSGGVMPKPGSNIEQNPYGMTLDISYEESTYEKWPDLIGDSNWSSDADEAKGAPIFLGTITWWGPEED
ncbi:MAG: hypothetical protein BM555_01820 [Crocinitomix sp. MedPE-SWsnd]|nr:MAG: hypothetical protein BM555_01820 [Crocinitomix sp. MedPE-SWsnd]